MMRTITMLTLSALLAGCMTQAELIAQQQMEVDRMMQLYGPACERLGYAGNTDGWRDCVLRLGTKESIDRRNFATINCWGHAGFRQCTTF